MENLTDIEVTANGLKQTTKTGQRLSVFVQSQGLALERVVVEYNGQPLTQNEARQVHLQAGDRLEIVRIVAGG